MKQQNDILNGYHFYMERCLFPFMEQTVEYLRLIGKIRTSETYAATLRSFKRFRNGEDVEIALMDSDLTQAHEAYLGPQSAEWYTVAKNLL